MLGLDGRPRLVDRLPVVLISRAQRVAARLPANATSGQQLSQDGVVNLVQHVDVLDAYALVDLVDR